MVDAPDDLAAWVGALVLSVGGTALLTRLLTRGDKEERALRVIDADWRAEVKADLKQLVQGISELTGKHGVLETKMAAYDARFAALEERQSEQAKAHLEAVAALRGEFSKRGRR